MADLQRISAGFHTAYLDHLGGKGLKKCYVKDASCRSDGITHTPWRLLDLLLTCIYWLLKSLDTSSKQA